MNQISAIIIFTFGLGTLSANTLSANSDSLIQIFNKTPETEKYTNAYKLINYWYSKKDDSVLFFINYIFDHNRGNYDTIYASSLKMRGNLHLFERDLINAEKYYKKALQIFQNTNHKKGADACLNNLGIVLLKQNKFDEAISFLQSSLDIAKNSNDTLSIGKTLHNIAYIYELKEDKTTALGYYLKALNYKRSTTDSASVSSTLNNIGNIYNSYREFDKAINYYQQSLKISLFRKDSNGVALRHYNLGRTYSKKNLFDTSMQHLLMSLEIFNELGNKYKMASVYNALANLFSTWDKNDKSIQYYKKALKFLDKNKDKIESARIYVNLADIYREEKQYKIAREYYNKAISTFENLEYFEEKFVALYNYAKLLIDLKQFDKAKTIFAKTIALAREKKQQYYLTNALLGYSNLYYNKKEYHTAIKLLKTALSKNNKENKVQTRSIYSHLSLNYKKIKKYKLALYYFEQAEILEDSIFVQQSLKNITELEKKYQLRQKEKEIMLLSSQNKLQKLENEAQKIRIENITLTRNFAIIGGLLLLLVIIYVIYSLVVKRKANQKLIIYNAEIIEQKEEIIAQRDEIENQLKQIASQKELLQAQQNNITDSITYARYIQHSIFPNDFFFQKYFNEYFIYYQPKDIVSGDFYFGEETETSIYLSVIDCTGHGVPGAFMSLLAYNALRTSVIEKQLSQPNKILEDIDLQIKTATHASAEVAGSGMDMILLKIDKKSNLLTVSGAKRPLIIFRNNKLTEILTTKRSIGKRSIGKKHPYTNEKWQLTPNDVLYMFTDGFSDQFGGVNRKKFKSSRLKNKLQEIQNMQLSIQKNILNRTFDDWKGENEQIDDILILGIKI